MSCQHCGWDQGAPHPEEGCPSDFKVGDEVYLVGDPDLAPLLAKFLGFSCLEPSVLALVETEGEEREVSYALLTRIKKWPVMTC